MSADPSSRFDHPLLEWVHDPLLLLTREIPGIGGKLRSTPEDFVVEERPAYDPCGEGEHLYLWIEKRMRTTDEVKRDLAQQLHIRADDVGSAGLKDRNAVTRQYLSVPARALLMYPGDPEEVARTLPLQDARVLRAARHRNKLRTGHLRGNRFEIRIRQPRPGAEEHAREIVRMLAERGVPNYYGEQRFGREGETVRMGLTLLGATGWQAQEMVQRDPETVDRGPVQPERAEPERTEPERTEPERMEPERTAPERTEPERARPRVSHTLRRLALSSVQSTLFNRALAERLRSGLLHRVLPGDVMQVVRSGGLFLAQGTDEQARYDAREIVTTGPMYGPQMIAAEGDPGAAEAALLAASGLAMKDFASAGGLLEGTRRAYVIWPEELEIEEIESDLRLRFALPAGAYATVLLRELMKEKDGR